MLSIDDFYLSHDDQIQLASKFPSNLLIQHRGQPSTHDLPLLLSVFSALRRGEECRLPIYDKSAFSGQGERAGKDFWPTYNTGNRTIGVVILEGWCVGFVSLSHRLLFIYSINEIYQGSRRRGRDHHLVYIISLRLNTLTAISQQRALDDGRLRRLWDLAVSQKDNGEYTGRLGWNSLENVQYVNDALRKYDEVTK